MTGQARVERRPYEPETVQLQSVPGFIVFDLPGAQTSAGGTRLAGSSLRMDRGVENLMKIAGLTLAEAITMATTNPARAGRVGGRLRGLQPGSRADVVKFRLTDGRIEVLETYLNGRKEF